MSKRDKTGSSIVPLSSLSAEQVIELSLRAISLRRTGHSWGTIAQQLGRTAVDVQALARTGYEHFLGQQDAETIRAEVEDRLDSIVRQVNVELATADNVTERNALYRTLIAVESSRARLLGLNLKPAGGDDA